jgi:Lysozyme like domain
MAYAFPAGNVIWKPMDIIALLCQPGFMSPDDWRPVTGCAVVMAESGGDPLATGPANWSPGNVAHLSIDLGIFQLNSYWHTVVDPFPDVPKITMADCFDPQKAMAQTWKVINKAKTGWNYNWTAWTAYQSGSYDKHVSASLAGMRAYRIAQSLPPGVFA